MGNCLDVGFHYAYAAKEAEGEIAAAKEGACVDIEGKKFLEKIAEEGSHEKKGNGDDAKEVLPEAQLVLYDTEEGVIAEGNERHGGEDKAGFCFIEACDILQPQGQEGQHDGPDHEVKVKQATVVHEIPVENLRHGRALLPNLP